MFVLAHLIVVLWGNLLAAVNADCYSHNGIPAQASRFYSGPELVSCGNGTNNCCKTNQKCGSNLLCAEPGTGAMSRQFCADKDWKGCSAMCPGFNAAGVDLRYCGQNVFCCPDAEKDCCTNGNGTLIDPYTGEMKPVSLGVRSTDIPVWWKADNSTSEATESTTSASASSTSAVDSALSASPPAAEKPQSSKNLSIGAGIGIGVGCTVIVVIIAVLGWFLWRRKVRRRTRELPTTEKNKVLDEMDTSKEGYALSQHDTTKSGNSVGSRNELEALSRQELEALSRQELDASIRFELG